MKLRSNFRDSEVLIRFKLTELLRSCSKRTIRTFQLSQQSCWWRIFRPLFQKRIQEYSVYKQLCFERKMTSEMKLNSEHLFEVATFEINAIWRMQYTF